MDDSDGFQVRSEAEDGAAVHVRSFESLPEALGEACRHLAANPGHVSWVVERRGGRTVREHPVRTRWAEIDPVVWARLVHLEWIGADVDVAEEDGGARATISDGIASAVGRGGTATEASEAALRRWESAQVP